MTAEGAIVVVNSGSSSVKFAAFESGEVLRRLWVGAVERIGFPDARLHVRDAAGGELVDEIRSIRNHEGALGSMIAFMESHEATAPLVAVGHRVAHGGAECDCPMFVDAALEARLRRLVPLAPLHLPHNLAGVAAACKLRPDVPQIACFDTAFHHGLPRVARMTALPRALEREGIRRFGFHGLSYEYVVQELRHRRGEAGAKERTVVAHLGNGSSMAAIRDGRSVETTMGFSTLAGLPMGTRCGDLDPGIVLYLLTQTGMSAKEVERLLYEQSGLLGISGISASMQDLLDHVDPASAEAVDYFCYRARSHLAAMTAALGGLDGVVFTGGIGANAPAVRARICDGLAYLGVRIDAARNARNAPCISTDDSEVRVETFATDEELMIARRVRSLLDAQTPTLKEA